MERSVPEHLKKSDKTDIQNAMKKMSSERFKHLKELLANKELTDIQVIKNIEASLKFDGKAGFKNPCIGKKLSSIENSPVEVKNFKEYLVKFINESLPEVEKVRNKLVENDLEAEIKIDEPDKSILTQQDLVALNHIENMFKKKSLELNDRMAITNFLSSIRVPPDAAKQQFLDEYRKTILEDKVLFFDVCTSLFKNNKGLLSSFLQANKNDVKINLKDMRVDDSKLSDFIVLAITDYGKLPPKLNEVPVTPQQLAQDALNVLRKKASDITEQDYEHVKNFLTSNKITPEEKTRVLKENQQAISSRPKLIPWIFMALEEQEALQKQFVTDNIVQVNGMILTKNFNDLKGGAIALPENINILIFNHRNSNMTYGGLPPKKEFMQQSKDFQKKTSNNPFVRLAAWNKERNKSNASNKVRQENLSALMLKMSEFLREDKSDNSGLDFKNIENLYKIVFPLIKDNVALANDVKSIYTDCLNVASDMERKLSSEELKDTDERVKIRQTEYSTFNPFSPKSWQNRKKRKALESSPKNAIDQKNESFTKYISMPEFDKDVSSSKKLEKKVLSETANNKSESSLEKKENITKIASTTSDNDDRVSDNEGVIESNKKPKQESYWNKIVKWWQGGKEEKKISDENKGIQKKEVEVKPEKKVNKVSQLWQKFKAYMSQEKKASSQSSATSEKNNTKVEIDTDGKENEIRKKIEGFESQHAEELDKFLIDNSFAKMSFGDNSPSDTESKNQNPPFTTSYRKATTHPISETKTETKQTEQKFNAYGEALAKTLEKKYSDANANSSLNLPPYIFHGPTKDEKRFDISIFDVKVEYSNDGTIITTPPNDLDELKKVLPDILNVNNSEGLTSLYVSGPTPNVKYITQEMLRRGMDPKFDKKTLEQLSVNAKGVYKSVQDFKDAMILEYKKDEDLKKHYNPATK